MKSIAISQKQNEKFVKDISGGQTNGLEEGDLERLLQRTRPFPRQDVCSGIRAVKPNFSTLQIVLRARSEFEIPVSRAISDKMAEFDSISFK